VRSSRHRVARVQDLPATWKPAGDDGPTIQLFGNGGWGLTYRDSSAGALKLERNLYEKVVMVVEGRGTTEVWQARPEPGHVLEWQKGSPVTIPPSTPPTHRSSRQRAALCVREPLSPTVRNVMTTRVSVQLPYTLASGFRRRRFSSPRDGTSSRDPISGLASASPNLIPTSSNTDLPLDNRRRPATAGSERSWAGNRSIGSDRRDRAALFGPRRTARSAAVLVCVQGQGLHLTRGRRRSAPCRGGRARRPKSSASRTRAGRTGRPRDERRTGSTSLFGVAHRKAFASPPGRTEQQALAQGRPSRRSRMDYGAIDLSKGGQRNYLNQEDTRRYAPSPKSAPDARRRGEPDEPGVYDGRRARARGDGDVM